MKFLAVEGAAAEAVRHVAEADPSLGPAESWSPALRSNLYTLLNSASPKMLLWGKQLCVFFNDAYAEVIQGRSTAGMGSPYPEFRPGLWPRIRESIERARHGEGSIVQEFTTERGEDGATSDGVYQLCFSPVLDEDRSISGVLIDIFDVTARKALEANLLGEIALLNGLFSTTPVLIAYASAPELRLEYVNAAFSRLLDGRPLIGRTVPEAIPETAELGFMSILRDVIDSGEPWAGTDIEVSLRPADGGEPVTRFLDFVYHPMRAPDGRIIGILFSGYDVTDRHRARAESERLRHQLLHSSRMSAMGTMAVTIAHELNQPLTAAANYLTAAGFHHGKAAGDDAELGALDAARDQLLRAGSIVKRMRSLVQCGEARTMEFDLELSIHRAVELVRANGHLDDFTVEVDVAEDARHAKGDDVQIEQVLVNLLRNAALASSGSDRRAALFTARRDDGMIEVRLRDWGPGLPPAREANLFGSMDERPAGEGLGVGLSLSRTIVEAHGGRIWGRNEEGGGALFGFTLPAGAGAAE